MTTIYASGRQTLSQDDWSITKTATEGELTSKTLYFSLQTKNNSGYNIPIVSSPIVINTNDKLTVTLEDTIRKEGEGWLYAVICCGLTNDPAEMNQVAKIPLFAVDQFGYPNIDDPVTYPITIDFSYNHQLSVGELLDEVVDLPSVNLINGIRYAVVEKDNNIYELDINSVAEVDDDVVLDAAIGRWILTSSFSNDVTDVTLAGGCNVNLLYLNDFSTVELPTYDVNGAASPKMQYWIVNDTGVDIEAGRSITLNVDAGGYDKSKLFDNKIAYIFHGFANVTTGELRTTYDESGENLLYINLENDYSANYPTVTIEDTLKNGEALFFSLFVKFDLLEVQGKLPNTTLSIFPELIKTSGTFNPLGTLFEKGIITKELNRLRVYPDEGLAVKVKSGSGIVRNYNFWKPLEQSVIGLTPNATNEIYVDKDGDVYLDTVENNDSVLRAIVKTLPIESKASDWSAYTAITLDSRLEVTVVYPCNADLIATIRANYPDVIAGTASYFNVRKINVYVQRQSDNEIRKFTNIFATPVANQVITISDWSSGTVVTELPTTEQGLFNPVTVTVANLPTGGNMTATNYRVAYSLVYDGTVVSDIDHSSSNGCITEVQLTAEDLFGTTSFNTLEEVRNITTLYDGRLIYCKQTNSGYFYNTTSNESDDGHDFIEPNVGDGCWINVRRDIVSKHLSTNDPTVNDDANDDFLNGDLWLNTTNDKYYVCVDNTVNNAIWKRLIYATDLATVATSGSYADLSDKPNNTIVVTVTGGEFRFNGQELSTGLLLLPNSTYQFDLSDPSNATYTLSFSTTIDGTNNGGTAYTTGVTTTGTPGTDGILTFNVPLNAPETLYPYCPTHALMGGSTVFNTKGGGASDASEVTVDASGFSGNLSTTDTDVQAALETIDSLVISPSITSRGTWDSGTSYIANDIVHYAVNGNTYIANTNNTNKIPGTDPEWHLFAQKGDTGSPGVQGEQGIQGEQGTAGLKADVTRTSSTSNTIGTGSKSFTFDTASNNLGWLNGTRLRATATAGNFMSGVVTSVSTTDVTINIDYISGSGTYTTWNISIAGEIGTPGSVSSASSLNLAHVATPSAPSAGNTLLYAKDDGKVYRRAAGENEVEIGSFSNTFLDNVFRIQDNSDNTKQLAFETSGITTGTTRTLTVPDSNGTVLSTDTVTDKALYYYDASSKLFKPVGIGTLGQTLIAQPSSNPPYQWATPTGGSTKFQNIESISATKTLTLNSEYFQFLTPTVSGVIVKLPSVTGSDYFEGEIINAGNGTNSLTIQENDGTAIITLSNSGNGVRSIYHYWDSSIWRVFERSYY